MRPFSLIFGRLVLTGMIFGALLSACAVSATPTAAPAVQQPTQAPAAPQPTKAPAGQVTHVPEKVASLAPTQPGLLPTRPAIEPTQAPQVLPTLVPSLYEQRLVVVDRPEQIRINDSESLKVSLVVDKEGRITPTAEYAGHTTTGTPVLIPNLYDTHNIQVEGRLDMAGVEISPKGTVTETLRPGEMVFFIWSIAPEKEGISRGTILLHLKLVPKNGGEIDRRILLAKPIEVEGVEVIGLQAKAARWAGLAGSALSMVLGFPFVESILSALWRRFRKK
jgi:hypothetical protein